MLSLRVHAIISGLLFAAIIALAAAGNVLHDSGLLPDESVTQMAARIVFFTLFLTFSFSMIPLTLKLFLAGQVAIGNGNRAIVQSIAAHQTVIVLAFWAFSTLGLSIAIPAAVEDGFFDPDPAAVIAATPSRGTLVARPGMDVADMRQQSSLKINGSPDSVITDGTLFDFQIAGTGISFSRCRYYYITTFGKDRRHIENISVGTSQGKVSRVGLAQANADLRVKLASDGWFTGHEVYRTEQDQRLHDGMTRGPSGDVWLKGETILRIMSRRIDDARRGEAADAGEWIQFVELSQRDHWTGIERYVFEPAH